MKATKRFISRTSKQIAPVTLTGIAAPVAVPSSEQAPFPASRRKLEGKTMFMRCAFLCVFVLGLAHTGTAVAGPHIPTDGNQVVERLPRRTDPVQRELRQLRGALSASPGDLRLAVTLAQRYIEQARIEGDPRYLGYAQAALRPWWTEPAPPEPVLILRATLRQSTHQFPAALADLDQAVKRDSSNLQAWLTQATVQTVIGRYDAARASCMRLYLRAPVLIVQTCLSNVGSVNGQASSSYRQLVETQARSPLASPGIGIWVDTLLAEMAARSGNDAEAERHFRKAMALGEPDSYLLGAYADFLLDHARAPEVVRLLRDKSRVDALLLRYALALRMTGSADAPAQAKALQTRFDAAMLRGDTVHQREQARFELALRDNPKAAVRLAKANWAVQKEPADLRILAESALASNDREAARLVLGWLTSSNIEDRHVAAIATRLKVNA